LSNWIDEFVQGALREIGTLLGTSVWGGVTSLFLGAWTLLLKTNAELIPSDVFKTDYGDKAVNARANWILADQIFGASSWLLGMSFAFALLWLYLVRIHRPTSPLGAVKFRRYWLTIAALLLGCTIAFYGFALYGGADSHSQFRELKDPSKLLLFVALALSTLAFLYVLSVLRSPPTVIAAVPFGGYFARLRWR
jgi:hypothetical protein